MNTDVPEEGVIKPTQIRGISETEESANVADTTQQAEDTNTIVQAEDKQQEMVAGEEKTEEVKAAELSSGEKRIQKSSVIDVGQLVTTQQINRNDMRKVSMLLFAAKSELSFERDHFYLFQNRLQHELRAIDPQLLFVVLLVEECQIVTSDILRDKYCFENLQLIDSQYGSTFADLSNHVSVLLGQSSLLSLDAVFFTADNVAESQSLVASKVSVNP